MKPTIEFLGEEAIVLTVAGGDEAAVQQRVWEVAARARAWPEAIEIVPGWNNLTLLVDPAVTRRAEVRRRLEQVWAEPLARDAATSPRTLDIPVRYGGDEGPDLTEVARRCSVSEAEVVTLHSRASYVVYFLGFEPGFAYLGGLDERLHVPRRAQPRVAVPAGSVGIGGSHTGVYPLRSPGGWQLIGRTSLRLFDLARDPAVLLAPGDRVRFVPT